MSIKISNLPDSGFWKIECLSNNFFVTVKNLEINCPCKTDLILLEVPQTGQKIISQGFLLIDSDTEIKICGNTAYINPGV